MKKSDLDSVALGRPYIEQNKRKWVRREVDFAVDLIFPTQGVRAVCAAKFRLKDLSEGGASIFVGSVKSVPDFFYMQFGDESSEMIGCYVVNRGSDAVNCQFWHELPSSALDAIIADKQMSIMFDLLEFNRKKQLEDELLSLLE